MTLPELLRRCVFVAGPTSVGKSEIALALASRHDGEIVCADAFQLYREFPVLSAQPSADEQAQVPHHLYGSVPCAEELDAARYANSAQTLLREIVARGKTPFVVGGSGLYLQALVAGLPALPSVDPALRDEVRAMSLEQMQAQLRELDLQSLLSIDANNPRRVARRLELCRQTGRPASEILTEPAAPEGLRGVVLSRDRDELRARIAEAVEARLAAGAIEEVSSTRDSVGTTARQILGWREISDLLDDKINRGACIELVTSATRQYAKRQLTWFRAKSTFPLESLSTVTSDHLDRLARLLGLSR